MVLRECCELGSLAGSRAAVGEKKRVGVGTTYGALDGSEGQQVLGSVAAVSAPGLVAGVVALLQDELLPLELWVLVAHPASERRERAVKRGRVMAAAFVRQLCKLQQCTGDTEKGLGQ